MIECALIKHHSLMFTLMLTRDKVMICLSGCSKVMIEMCSTLYVQIHT